MTGSWDPCQVRHYRRGTLSGKVISRGTPATFVPLGHPAAWAVPLGCSVKCAPVANAGAPFRWGKQALGRLRSEGAPENTARLCTGRQGFGEAFSKGQQPVTQMLTRAGDLFLEPGEIMESDGNVSPKVRMRAHLTPPLSLEPARQWARVCLSGVSHQSHSRLGAVLRALRGSISRVSGSSRDWLWHPPEPGLSFAWGDTPSEGVVSLESLSAKHL